MHLTAQGHTVVSVGKRFKPSSIPSPQLLSTGSQDTSSSKKCGRHRTRVCVAGAAGVMGSEGYVHRDT